MLVFRAELRLANHALQFWGSCRNVKIKDQAIRYVELRSNQTTQTRVATRFVPYRSVGAAGRWLRGKLFLVLPFACNQLTCFWVNRVSHAFSRLGLDLNFGNPHGPPVLFGMKYGKHLMIWNVQESSADVHDIVNVEDFPGCRVVNCVVRHSFLPPASL